MPDWKSSISHKEVAECAKRTTYHNFSISVNLSEYHLIDSRISIKAYHLHLDSHMLLHQALFAVHV